MTPSFARSLLLPLGVALLVIAPSAAQAGAVPVVPFNEISKGTLGLKGDAALDEDGTVCADPCDYGPYVPPTPEERQRNAEFYKIDAPSAGSQETSGTSEASSAAPEESSAAPEESTAASEASSEETTANEESTESEWSDDE